MNPPSTHAQSEDKAPAPIQEEAEAKETPSDKEKPINPSGDQSRPTARLRQGLYTGVIVSSSAAQKLPRAVEAFLGVPYASSSRFASPLPLAASDKTSDAHVSGPQCHAIGPVTNLDSDDKSGVESEDCLNADVYRPQGAKSGGGLPVLVSVHGGAFVSGNTSERSLASFVSSSTGPSVTGGGVVAVAFNYRLGALGFLSSSVMAKEKAVNLGLEDQQMLLSWVRDNIVAFGGDPARVTLLGFSSGAHSVRLASAIHS